MAKTQYEVSGTRAQLGAIGSPENFAVVVSAENAKEAYMTVIQDNRTWERIHVIAIKIECTVHPNCFHLAIPTEYYLGV